MPYATNPADGVRIYYETEGEGPPLVLHHGGGGSHYRWRELGYVEALRDQFRLVLFDARGHGQSGKPTVPEAYRYERWVQDVVAILDDLEIDRAHFFGYSLGGLVGFRIPVYAPDRFASLALGGCHPFDLRDFWEGEVERFKEGGKLAIERAEEAGRQLGEVELEALRSGAREALALAFREEPGLDDQLSSFSIPMLMLVGGDDQTGNSGRRAPGAIRRIPGATLVMFSGLGHFDVLPRLDLVLPNLRTFLDQVESPEARVCLQSVLISVDE